MVLATMMMPPPAYHWADAAAAVVEHEIPGECAADHGHHDADGAIDAAASLSSQELPEKVLLFSQTSDLPTELTQIRPPLT